MKTPRFALWLVIPFVLGALCAPRRGTALGKLLNQTGPHSQEIKKSEPQAGAAPARDSRISRVLSTLLETSRLKQRHELFLAIGDLAPSDLTEMMARADKLPQQYRDRLLVVIVDRWLELDPDSASKWVHAHPEELACQVMWARHFPKEALAEIHANPWLPSAKTLLKESLTQMVGSDAGTQTAALAKLPADHVRDAFLRERFRDWSKDDPAAAFAFAQGSSAVPFDLCWSAIDPWAARDPAAAAKAVAAMLPSLENPKSQLPTVANVAAALAGKGIDAAFAWANQLPAEFQDVSFRTVAGVWAKSEPAAALTWCLENGIDPAARRGLASGTSSPVERAMRADPAQTLDWIQSLPANAARDALLERALKASPSSSSGALTPQEADAKIASLSLLPADFQQRVAYELGKQNTRSLDAARLWADRLPEGPVRAAAIESAVKRYFEMDPSPENEAKVLRFFPDAADRETVLSGILPGKAQSDPASAALDALSLRDPVRRRDVFDNIISDWLTDQPTDARAWLSNTLGIPPDWVADSIKERKQPAKRIYRGP